MAATVIFSHLQFPLSFFSCLIEEQEGVPFRSPNSSMMIGGRYSSVPLFVVTF